MKHGILVLLTALAGYPQQIAEPPSYEVVSIKPNADGDYRYTFRFEPGGTLAATGITLKRLMMTAYNVQGFRIVGGPTWVNSSRWDVRAKPNRAVTDAEIRPMLRTLLEEQFQLRARKETRTLPVYELDAGGRGPRVPKVKDVEAEPTVRVGYGSIQLTKATAATFAS